MSLRRGASLSGLEDVTDYNFGKGDSFRQRMSLASLGTRKYGRSGAFCIHSDNGEEDSITSGSESLIVRHVPLVIEEEEGDEVDRDLQINHELKTQIPIFQTSYFKEPKLWRTVDDRSSVSSVSSDNSIDTSRRKAKLDQEVKRWMDRSGDDTKRLLLYHPLEQKGDEMSFKNMLRRKPFLDINQIKESNKNMTVLRKPCKLGLQYVIQTETVGAKNCPVHGEGKSSLSLEPLLAPSLIKRSSMTSGKTNSLSDTSNLVNGRPKHSTHLQKKPIRDNTGRNSSERKNFTRGPGQWSIKKKYSESEENTNVPTGDKQTETPSYGIQRSWSLRKPSPTTSQTFKHTTLSSISRSQRALLPLPEYFRKDQSEDNEKLIQPLKKDSSQTDLNNISENSSNRMMKISPASSTHSICSKVIKDFVELEISKPKYVGILKTPGKRKLSSNNRVEFLDNLEEREIPGRYT